MYYIAYLYKDSAPHFSVSFPDFPGCVAAGQSFAEAYRLATEALALHIAAMLKDGVTLPQPSTLDSLAEDPARKAAFPILIWVEAKPPLTSKIGFARDKSFLWLSYDPHAGKVRIKLPITQQCLNTYTEDDRRVREKYLVRVGHERDWGWTDRYDHVRLTVPVLAEVPVAKLALRSFIWKQGCFQYAT